MKRIFFSLLIFTLKSFGQKETEVVFYSVQEALVNPTIVKSIDLSGQNLTKLPSEIIKFSNLESIDISSNSDMDLTQAFDILKQIGGLKTLLLRNGKIKNIPDNISQLRNLEELWLDENELTSIPEPVKQLKHLKYLRLFSNRIKSISFKKNELPDLISIDLCYNEFETFPIQLAILSNLKRIVIWFNTINRIPAGISQFEQIEEINLEHNDLHSLPEQLGQLKSLQKLSLRGNRLTENGISVIFQLYKLKELDLQDNNIAVLSEKVQNLKELERLSLSDNPLKELPGELEQVKTLQQLGLGDLHSLNWTKAFSIMEKLPNLRRVGMYTMKLQTMPIGFNKLQQVDTFWLTYNWFDDNERKRILQMVPKAKIDFD